LTASSAPGTNTQIRRSAAAQRGKKAAFRSLGEQLKRHPTPRVRPVQQGRRHSGSILPTLAFSACDSDPSRSRVMACSSLPRHPVTARVVEPHHVSGARIARPLPRTWQSGHPGGSGQDDTCSVEVSSPQVGDQDPLSPAATRSPLDISRHRCRPVQSPTCMRLLSFARALARSRYSRRRAAPEPQRPAMPAAAIQNTCGGRWWYKARWSVAQRRRHRPFAPMFAPDVEHSANSADSPSTIFCVGLLSGVLAWCSRADSPAPAHHPDQLFHRRPAASERPRYCPGSIVARCCPQVHIWSFVFRGS